MSIDYKKMTTVNSSRKILAPIETATPQQVQNRQRISSGKARREE
jgi:hypothetical protein